MNRIMCLSMPLIIYFIIDDYDFAFWAAWVLAIIAEIECFVLKSSGS
jgi:hypothetical protein